jgi:hypothetical protein
MFWHLCSWRDGTDDHEGPLWQSRINVVLRKALGLGGVAPGTLPTRTAGAGLAQHRARARARRVG